MTFLPLPFASPSLAEGEADAPGFRGASRWRAITSLRVVSDGSKVEGGQQGKREKEDGEARTLQTGRSGGDGNDKGESGEEDEDEDELHGRRRGGGLVGRKLRQQVQTWMLAE